MVIGRSLAYSLRRRHSSESGENVADDKPEIARWVDEGAKAIGLPIALEYREKVILNVERSLAIAQPLLALELEDELTPLPVYRP
jgi:hypothetical protein